MVELESRSLTSRRWRCSRQLYSPPAFYWLLWRRWTGFFKELFNSLWTDDVPESFFERISKLVNRTRRSLSEVYMQLLANTKQAITCRLMNYACREKRHKIRWPNHKNTFLAIAFLLPEATFIQLLIYRSSFALVLSLKWSDRHDYIRPINCRTIILASSVISLPTYTVK